MEKTEKQFIDCRRPASWLIILALFFPLSGFGKVKLSSRRLDRQIAIDGRMDEWKNTLAYVSNKKLSIGVMNDDQYLYLCLVCSERGKQMQIMRQGLRLWLDPSGKNKRARGIKYPVGVSMDEAAGNRMMERPDPDRIKDQFEATLARIEILADGGENGYSYRVDRLKGLRVRLKVTQGLMVYELRIPLRRPADGIFGIGWTGGDTLGLVLETPKFERPEGMGKGPGGDGVRMEGMPGGRGGMRGGGRGMRPPGMGFYPPKPLKIKARITLATQ